jgi:hypothetical protein
MQYISIDKAPAIVEVQTNKQVYQIESGKYTNIPLPDSFPTNTSQESHNLQIKKVYGDIFDFSIYPQFRNLPNISNLLIMVKYVNTNYDC